MKRPLIYLFGLLFLSLIVAPRSFAQVTYTFTYTASSGPIHSFSFSFSTQTFITGGSPAFTPFTVTDGINTWNFTLVLAGVSNGIGCFAFGTPGTILNNSGCDAEFYSGGSSPLGIIWLRFADGLPNASGVYTPCPLCAPPEEGAGWAGIFQAPPWTNSESIRSVTGSFKLQISLRDFVGIIPDVPTPRIAIQGEGFGTLPASYGLTPSTPFTGVTPYLRFRDVTQGWEAGYQALGSLIGDSCTVTIYDWDPTKLGIKVNAGRSLCPTPAIGDQAEVDLCNPGSASCTPDSSSSGAVQLFKTVTGQVTLRLFIPNNLHAQQIGGLSVGFMRTNLDQMTNGIVTDLATLGITITRQDVGYALVDQSTIPTDAVSELSFLISAPDFFAHLVDASSEAPELLPVPFVQEFGIPSPPEIVVQEIEPVANAEAQLKLVSAEWCSEVPDVSQVPEYLIAREVGTDQELQITISNLSRVPASLNVPVTYYVVGLGTCTEETSGYLDVQVSPPVQSPQGPILVTLSPGSH